MNILFVSDHYTPHVNGIVTHIVLLKKELERRGHRILILTLKVRGQKKEKDIYAFPSFPSFLRADDRIALPFNPSIEKQILSQPIDIIHTHQGILGYTAKRLAAKARVPLVGTFHTFFSQYVDWFFPKAKKFTHPLLYGFTRDYYNHYDLVLAPSQKSQQELQKSHLTAPIRMLHNGIELHNFYTATAQPFKKQFQIHSDRPLIVIVSTLEVGKNIDLAIEAIAHVRRRIPTIQLAIVGDGTLRKKLESLITEKQLENNVIITGFLNRDMVASANKAADLVLFTSDTDNFPTVLIEAQAAAKPIVAVKDLAVLSLVKDNYNGFLTTKNPEDIAQAIETVLTNRSLMHTYGVASKKLSSELSVTTYVSKLEAIYNNLKQKKQKYSTILQ